MAYKLRGGGPTRRNPPPAEFNENLADYSTYMDIDPLKKAYKSKTGLRSMLDYRTKLAEILLRKALLMKGRGGGPDDLDPDDIDNEDIKTDNMVTEFNIGINKVKIEFEVITTGIIDESLEGALRAYLRADVDDDDHRECIIESTLNNLIIWKDNDLYFIFDPKPRDDMGNIYGWDEWSAKIYPEPEQEEEEEEEEEEETPA